MNQRLKEERERAGLSQRALAKKIGLPPNYISRYENEEVTPPQEKMKLIADELKVNVGYLFFKEKLQKV